MLKFCCPLSIFQKSKNVLDVIQFERGDFEKLIYFSAVSDDSQLCCYPFLFSSWKTRDQMQDSEDQTFFWTSAFRNPQGFDLTICFWLLALGACKIWLWFNHGWWITFLINWHLAGGHFYTILNFSETSGAGLVSPFSLREVIFDNQVILWGFVGGRCTLHPCCP